MMYKSLLSKPLPQAVLLHVSSSHLNQSRSLPAPRLSSLLQGTGLVSRAAPEKEIKQLTLSNHSPGAAATTGRRTVSALSRWAASQMTEARAECDRTN